MEEGIKKVLQMDFVTREGGSVRVTIGEPREGLSETEVKAVMDTVVTAGALKGGKGVVIGKGSARFITQEIEKLEIA